MKRSQKMISAPEGDSEEAEEVLMKGALEKRKRAAATLTKVISGGQTGADRAALEAAHSQGIATGGIAPTGFKTATGKDLVLKTVYGLTDRPLAAVPGFESRLTLSQEYAVRSQRNVDTSDATVAFCLKPGTGTSKTINYCANRKWGAVPKNARKSNYRPHLVIDNMQVEPMQIAARIVEFLKRHRVRTLNVCGHRDDATAGVEDFQKKVFEILSLAFA
jgi:hypothetical protein